MKNIAKYLLASSLALLIIITVNAQDSDIRVARSDLAANELVASMPPLRALGEDLSLEIRSDRTDYALGEPIILYVTLRNNGAQPVEVMRFLEPEYGYVEYKSRTSNGEEMTFLPWSYKEHIDPKKTLLPGEAVYGTAKIFYGGDGWTFTEPGSYEIWAVYDEGIRSNSLNIEVRPPQNNAEQRAADLFLSSDEVGKFLLFEGGDHLSDGMARLNSVATELPETPHAVYANYALGNNLLTDFANFEDNSLRVAEPQKAVMYLEKAEDRPINFYYTVQTSLALSEGYMKLGDSAMAREEINNLGTIVSTQYAEFQPLFSQAAMNRKSLPMESMNMIETA